MRKYAVVGKQVKPFTDSEVSKMFAMPRIHSNNRFTLLGIIASLLLFGCSAPTVNENEGKKENSSRDSASFYFNDGIKKYQEGEYFEAISSFDKAIEESYPKPIASFSPIKLGMDWDTNSFAFKKKYIGKTILVSGLEFNRVENILGSKDRAVVGMKIAFLVPESPPYFSCYHNKNDQVLEQIQTNNFTQVSLIGTIKDRVLETYIFDNCVYMSQPIKYPSIEKIKVEKQKAVNSLIAYKQSINTRIISQKKSEESRDTKISKITKSYEELVKADPSDQLSWFSFGKFSVRAGNYKDAIKYLNQATELKPGFSMPYILRAYAHAWLGSEINACKEIVYLNDILTGQMNFTNSEDYWETKKVITELNKVDRQYKCICKARNRRCGDTSEFDRQQEEDYQ